MRVGAVFVGLAVASAAFDAGAQEAETLYQDSCRNCHGPKGQGMASFPKLAGHSEDYLTDRLETYRAGERVGSNSALMQPHATDLSDDEIAGLATYIASFD